MESRHRLGAKQRLYGGLVKALGAGKVGQARNVGCWGLAGDEVHGLSQGDDLQCSVWVMGAGKGLPLRLEHLSR